MQRPGGSRAKTKICKCTLVCGSDGIRRPLSTYYKHQKREARVQHLRHQQAEESPTDSGSDEEAEESPTDSGSDEAEAVSVEQSRAESGSNDSYGGQSSDMDESVTESETDEQAGQEDEDEEAEQTDEQADQEDEDEEGIQEDERVSDVDEGDCEVHGADELLPDELKVIFEIQKSMDDHFTSTKFQNEMLSHVSRMPESKVPSSRKKRDRLYEVLGAPNVERWRMCCGYDGNYHDAVLLRPSLEDVHAGKDALCCACQPRTLKRTCQQCCERCAICNAARKDMLPVDYLPLGAQLRAICKSSSFCHEMLQMHRLIRRGDSDKDYKFWWDGRKFEEYHDFWDADSTFELPIVCSGCSMTYSTFPPSRRSPSLVEVDNAYDFDCSQCGARISSQKKMVKGDPRNFAILCHSDGFLLSKSRPHSSAVVEFMVLNSGRQNSLGPLPLLFISLDHPRFRSKLWKERVNKSFQQFLVPLVEELKALYIDGLNLHYNYPVDMINGMVSQDCVLRVLLAAWSGDHPAQCKVGYFKGTAPHCRRCYPSFTRMLSKRAVAVAASTASAEVNVESTEEDESGGKKRRFRSVQKLMSKRRPMMINVYDNARAQVSHPPRPKTAVQLYKAVLEARVAPVESRQRIWDTVGLSGESMLWQLYELYGFDPTVDVVYDVMHVLALNLFFKFFKFR